MPRDSNPKAAVPLPSDLDNLFAHLGVNPLAVVEVPGRLARIEGLDVEVLDIRPGVGDTPGDSLIVAENDGGKPRQAHARDIYAGCLQMDHVPNAGQTVAEVRVVGEERLPARRMASADGPVVASQAGGRRF